MNCRACSLVLPLIFSQLACAALGAAPTAGAEPSARPPQAIILKLDDVTPQGARDGSPVSPRWQRLVDFIEEQEIKASLGIIGFALEDDNAAFFDWIKQWHRKGRIEFWNHGYRNRRAEDKTGEFEGAFDEQKAAIERTQRLAKEKLGIELKVFGAHWSGTNQATADALDATPEITMVFYEPRQAKKFVFERVLTLENPTFVPDFDKFKQLYESRAADKPVLALQGHPNAWDEQRWQGFVKIIEFLKGRGCRFVHATEYRAESASVDRREGNATAK